jgi:hypothetical protein
MKPFVFSFSPFPRAVIFLLFGSSLTRQTTAAVPRAVSSRTHIKRGFRIIAVHAAFLAVDVIR